MMSKNPETVDLCDYLCTRLKQIGIQSVHGVPALDYVEKCGLNWIGNCNELNAAKWNYPGYAADGYARINGISALMTVMGVGELSAFNAIAGAFAEFVPVIHIVGKPSRQAHKNRLCVHHSLGDGDLNVFEEMSRKVSCLTVNIDSPETAASLIDEAIRTCWIQSRPVSIYIPCDMYQIPIPCQRLRSQSALGRDMPPDDVHAHERLVDAAMREIRLAANPVILVGSYGIHHGAKAELDDFLSKVDFPVFAASSGLGIVDSRLPRFVGLYVGSCSNLKTREKMESADLVICIGNIQSDLSTSGFNGVLQSAKLIEIERTKARVKGQAFEGIYANNVLKALAGRIGRSTKESVCVDASHHGGPSSVGAHPQRPMSSPKNTTLFKSGLQILTSLPDYVNPLSYIWPKPTKHVEYASEKSAPITHDWFWPSLGKWLRTGDIILTETGTSSFGIWNTTLPPDSIFIAQYLWSSIGYTVGACQGTAQAVRDSANTERRTILFIGDGSLQCGCQELSTIIRQGLTPIIFVICNNGYTVERLIHGEKQIYNDIQPWNHRLLPAVFGAAPGTYQTHRVETTAELEALWRSATFTDCSVLQVSPPDEDYWTMQAIET
ncbi:unnamed protein product [Penicillium olsonii]|uniref:Pyruvate decarboxylase n=1 Tax=Penicillium olsonii TaxID=99116 RepID=A0A9W4MLB3_PENOL|nr:unnamed protein product [Penicillium olsonii]CAG8040041.1 unnamed protein product [Penicillium olsonii]